MPTQRHTLRAAVFIVLEKDGKVLLSRRFQTHYYDGSLGIPAGHLDGGETPTQAIIREAAEEVGVVVLSEQVHFAHVMHRISPDVEYMDIYFTCTGFSGEPTIREPEKCSELVWAPYGALPTDMLPEVKLALEYIRARVAYSEYLSAV